MSRYGSARWTEDLFAEYAKRRTRWSGLAPDTGIVQPAERTTGGGVEVDTRKPEICSDRIPREETSVGATGFVRSPSGGHQTSSRAGVTPGPLTSITGGVRAIGIAGRDEYSSGAMDASHAGSIPAATPNKYRNVKTNGYASAKEAKRAAELRLLEKAGAIRNLREQVPFLLIPVQGEERACWYVCDFQYEEEPREHGWQKVTEDCKGMRTRDYIIKRKLMKFIHGIVIRET